MRPLGRNIPWKSISIPWIRRSKGWNFRSKATFQRKNSSETCHIVAKTPFSAVPAAVRRTDVFHYQTFLIFAYLRARAQALENNRFSMLKGRRSSPPACCRGRLCTRVRHAHPRLQSSSAPLGPPFPVAIPLQNRGSDAVPAVIPAACRCGTAVLMPMSVQRIRDAVVPVAIPAACRCDTAVLIPTSVQQMREAAGPAGVALLCSRG